MLVAVVGGRCCGAGGGGGGNRCGGLSRVGFRIYLLRKLCKESEKDCKDCPPKPVPAECR